MAWKAGLCVVCMLLVVVARASAAEPYRFGPLGARLTREDLAAIASATGVEPWAILGWYSQVLPEVRYVDAFLPATASTEKLRSGSVAHLQCKPVSDEATCLGWTKQPALGAYVQVLVGSGSLRAEHVVRSPSERPIRVTGRFSAADLLGLVTYIRSGPRSVFPDGGVGMAVSVDLPIQDIEEQPDGSVWVRLTRDGGTGQTATILRERRGWRITQVVGWVG
jgi:hypothetical protein